MREKISALRTRLSDALRDASKGDPAQRQADPRELAPYSRFVRAEREKRVGVTSNSRKSATALESLRARMK